jgi:TusA-related sulfurtransferase
MTPKIPLRSRLIRHQSHGGRSLGLSVWASTLTLASILSTAGCDDKTPKEPSPPPEAAASVTASAAPTAAASAAAVDDSPKKKKGKAKKPNKCPNAVDGAETTVEDTKTGVVMTVVAKDAAATEEIRKRAKIVSEEKAKEGDAKRQHTGDGQGGGGLGRCPVVLRDTVVQIEDVDGGSKFTIDAKDPAEIDGLRRDVKERRAKLEAGASSDE